MKLVLFDGTSTQPSTKATFHGGSEYAKCILREILKKRLPIDIIFDQNLPIPEDILEIINSNNIKVFYITSKKELYDVVDGGGYDIFYSALPYLYFDYKGNTPIIGVIHGLRNIEFPWDKYYHKFIKNRNKRVIGLIISKMPFLWQYLKRKNLKKIQSLILNPKFKFITVSEHSKYSIINYFPSLPNKHIEVFYSPLIIEQNKSVSKPSSESYFLLVSGNRSEKNIIRAARAFDELFSTGLLKDRTVIITGITDTSIFSNLKNIEKFEFLPYVSSQKLNDLYQNAFCFVYPSLNEGFGYPPLQAMAYRVPVIASSATSIPEVCDNAAIYFSPTNIDDLKNRILQIDGNPDLRSKLINNGVRRLSEIQTRQKSDINKLIELIFY